MISFSQDERLHFVDSDSAGRDFGARFRRTRPGPELDLVDFFLGAMPLTIPKYCRATVFRELQLESGVPDIVIVVWHERIARNWSSERVSLRPHDLRLMHFLHHARRARKDELTDRYGQRATTSIERLYGADMIKPIGPNWVPCALRQTFAAVKIIAIEAKIGKWADVLNQARLNTWFASKSYVLVPNVPPESKLLEARQLGIGVCSQADRAIKEVASASAPLPRSYASWMLNELAWRFAQDVERVGEC